MKPKPSDFGYRRGILSWRLVDVLVEINTWNSTYRPTNEQEWSDVMYLYTMGWVTISDSYNFVSLTEDGIDMIFDE